MLHRRCAQAARRLCQSVKSIDALAFYRGADFSASLAVMIRSNRMHASEYRRRMPAWVEKQALIPVTRP